MREGSETQALNPFADRLPHTDSPKWVKDFDGDWRRLLPHNDAIQENADKFVTDRWGPIEHLGEIGGFPGGLPKLYAELHELVAPFISTF